MNMLGQLLLDIGQIEKAQPLYEMCFTRRKAIFGEDDPLTLQSMNALAGLYESQGKEEKSLSLRESCLQKRKAILGAC